MRELLHRVIRSGLLAWARRELRKGLDRVDVEGVSHLETALRQGPVVVASNHVSFWDALLYATLTDALDARAHVLVDAASVERFPFFSVMGAVPIDLTSRAGSVRGLRASAQVLGGPGDLLWVFPQGRYRPQEQRPLDLKPGVEWIARKAEARVVPAALSFTFLEDPRPAAFVQFGEPLAETTLDSLEKAIVWGLEAAAQRAERARLAVAPPQPGAWSRALAVMAGSRRG